MESCAAGPGNKRKVYRSSQCITEEIHQNHNPVTNLLQDSGLATYLSKPHFLIHKPREVDQKEG